MKAKMKYCICISFVVLLFSLLNIPAYAHNTIAASGNHTVGIKIDGTVVAVGAYKYGQCDVENWTDIIEVAAGAWHTVGLKSDGTVVAVGDNGCGQCNVSGWKDIVSVTAGGAFRKGHTVGLKSDGTVVAVGNNDEGQCNVSDWKNIIAIAAGQSHTIGLKRDGSVIAIGNNDEGQCNVSKWNDIVAISANDNSTIGLDSKGTVVGNINYTRYSNTAIQAIAAGSDYTLRLKSDGTVDDLGWRGQWFSSKDSFLFSKWQNIVAITAGGHTAVGLKADGTVVANGENNYGQCSVENWHNIRKDLSMAIPDTSSTNNYLSSSDNSSIIDLSSGRFIVNLQELALPIDLRLALYETGLGAELAESNAKMMGRSNYIIAIGEKNDSGISQKRVAAIYGIDNSGERTDGTNNIDIVKLHCVVYSKNAAQILSVITAVMSVCEKSLLSDQIIDAAVELCNNAIVNGNSRTYTQNGVCYVLSSDFLGQINFEVYACDVLDDRNTSNPAGNSNKLQTEKRLESDTATTNTHLSAASNFSGDSSITSNSTGNRNALRTAKSYLDYSGFSRKGLIDQLEYEGYSNAEAVSAVDSCGADWNSQAVRVAKDYIDYSGFSRRGLINQLMHDGFSFSQAEHGVDHIGADWNEQATRVAKSYLYYSAFSKSKLIEQLEYEGFTHEQAVFGVERNGY